jgi:hypothetical protein
MNVPVTELDRRFSDPAAAPATWDETRRVLEQAELSWIATSAPATPSRRPSTCAATRM